MTTNYVDYVLELLSPFGLITAKAMFGGHGIYKDKIIFALIVDNELYFKVDDSNQQEYEELDSAPFTYEAKGKKVAMSYWKVPIEVLEDEAKLSKWVDQSYSISLQKLAKTSKRPAR